MRFRCPWCMFRSCHLMPSLCTGFPHLGQEIFSFGFDPRSAMSLPVVGSVAAARFRWVVRSSCSIELTLVGRLLPFIVPASPLVAPPICFRWASFRAMSIANRSIGTPTMYRCSGSRRPRLLFNMAQRRIPYKLYLHLHATQASRIPVLSERVCEPSPNEPRSLLRACAGGGPFVVPPERPVGTAILIPLVRGTVGVVLEVPEKVIPIDAIVPSCPETRCPPTWDGRP